MGVAVLAAGGYLYAIQLLGNFHEVVAGQLYRSNQPSNEELVRYTRDHDIKTVINLRGPNESKAWYRDEVETARELGLRHIDFGMSASQELDMSRVNELVAIMRDAPKPILIHCKAGADRTGLATALYLSRVARLGEKEAESQLSVRYGHIGIPYLSATYAMDQTWENVEHMPITDDFAIASNEF
ncbi:dual specificity protein phosphatase family protein [Agrobacterium tumefaciens]|uniref:dual specificity protein phosphatase family protein n=1 Tax=Agrobacterium tumefaciens TaxID=358 RepID=UPI00157163B9|nr:dual specificity protein phosphatase family protein [Agrobacterium tumefaciens]NSX90389.1 dual specificity protein phosphatase family protein [Agrobacterium tumefaciens]